MSNDNQWDPMNGAGNQANPTKTDDIPDIAAAQAAAAAEAALLDRRDDDLLPDKPRDAEIYSVIARKIRERRAFAENFAVVSADGGKTTSIVEVDADNVCTQVRRERVADLLVCWGDRKGKSTYRLEPRKAMECAKYWAASVDRMPEPATALWPGEQGLCYHRYPFRPAPGDDSLWREVNSRMDNPREFNLWVASLFHEKADRTQYVWLWGPGGTGKSEIIRALKWTFGAAGLVMNALPDARDQFWSEMLPGIRFLGFSDVTHSNELRHGIFKSLVGGDAIVINKKNKNRFATEVILKMLCASNQRARITEGSEDQRRILAVNLTPFTTQPDPCYQAKLSAQMPAYINRCLAEYEREMPQHGRIIPSSEAKASALEMASDFNAKYEDLCATKLYIAPTSGAGTVWTSSPDLENLLKDHWKNREDVQEGFKRWLLYTHGISRSSGSGERRNQKGYKRLGISAGPGHDAAREHYADLAAGRLSERFDREKPM